MQMVVPEGVLLNNTFLDGPKSLALKHLREMYSQLELAAREANLIGVDVVVQVGAPVCLAQGIGGDEKIIQCIEKATGVPATTSVTSMVKALHTLGIEKIVVFSPYYSEDLADMLQKFFESSGFNIVSFIWKRDVKFSTISEIPQHQTYRLAKASFLEARAADGLLLPGGGAPTSSIVEILEMDLGKPVVSHNFATIWDVLNMANVRQPIEGYGRLLTMF
jgi:maleate isomerase